jgi:hypothetical protein
MGPQSWPLIFVAWNRPPWPKISNQSLPLRQAQQPRAMIRAPWGGLYRSHCSNGRIGFIIRRNRPPGHPSGTQRLRGP